MQSTAEVFEAAARAVINERCADAFLHDVRGSMQALFSALELLSRSARQGGDAVRIEKVCDMAKRAIVQHEKSTMDILRLLTAQQAAMETLDLGALVQTAVHFLRNDATNKSIVFKVIAPTDLTIRAESAKLQTMLVGLLTVALDHAQPATELQIAVESAGEGASVRIPSTAGFEQRSIESVSPSAQMEQRDLILLFAQQLMQASGGRLEVSRDAGDSGALMLYFPTSARRP